MNTSSHSPSTQSPSSCCSECRRQPCIHALLRSAPIVIVSSLNSVPRGCPVQIKYLGASALHRLLEGMRMNELQELFKQATRAQFVGPPPRTKQDLVRFLERALPTSHDVVLAVPPASKAERSVKALFHSRNSSGGSGEPKKDGDSEAHDSDKNQNAFGGDQDAQSKPSLHHPAFVFIDDDKQPGSPEHVIDEGSIGETVYLKVDSDHLMPGDVVQFHLYRKARKGGKDQGDEKLETLSGQVGQGRKDKAATAHWFIPERSHAGAFKAREDSFYFVARQSEHKLEIKSDELKLSEAFDGCIFYSPTQSEYLLIDSQEDFQAFSTQVERSHALRGKTTQAWEKPDAKERKEELEKLRKEWEELFEGKAIAEADKALEEILLVKGNKRWGTVTAFTHVPTAWRKDEKKIPGRWAKHSDKSLQKELDKILKKHKDKESEKEEHKGTLEGKLKWKLLDKEPVIGSVWPWAHLSTKEKKQPGEQEDQFFEFSAEAAMGRYAAGYKGEAEIDLKERKFSLAAFGNASFALLEGKMSGEIYLPEREGINLLGFLCAGKGETACRENGHACLLRITFAGEAGLFAGVSAGGSIAFPAIDLSKDVEKRKAEAGGEIQGFAGARATGAIKLKAQWSKEPKEKFGDLGEIGGEAAGSAGIGGGLAFKISYQNGRFHFQCSASLTIGLGGKAGWSFDVAVEEGWKLIHHIASSMDFHYVMEIEEEAYKVYKNYTFALIAEGEETLLKGAHHAIDSVHNFGHWLVERKDHMVKIEKGIMSAPLRQIMYQDLPPEA